MRGGEDGAGGPPGRGSSCRRRGGGLRTLPRAPALGTAAVALPPPAPAQSLRLGGALPLRVLRLELALLLRTIWLRGPRPKSLCLRKVPPLGYL